MRLISNRTLCFYRGDYGVPIAYTATGFAIGDKIVFCVTDNIISPKVFAIDALNENDEFNFELCLNENEAKKVALNPSKLFWSFKHYRAGVFIDTVAAGDFEIKEAAEWQN